MQVVGIQTELIWKIKFNIQVGQGKLKFTGQHNTDETEAHTEHSGALRKVILKFLPEVGFKKKTWQYLVKIKPGHTCVFLQVVKGPKYFKYG